MDKSSNYVNNETDILEIQAAIETTDAKPRLEARVRAQGHLSPSKRPSKLKRSRFNCSPKSTCSTFSSSLKSETSSDSSPSNALQLNEAAIASNLSSEFFSSDQSFIAAFKQTDDAMQISMQISSESTDSSPEFSSSSSDQSFTHLKTFNQSRIDRSNDVPIVMLSDVSRSNDDYEKESDSELIERRNDATDDLIVVDYENESDDELLRRKNDTTDDLIVIDYKKKSNDELIRRRNDATDDLIVIDNCQPICDKRSKRKFDETPKKSADDESIEFRLGSNDKIWLNVLGKELFSGSE